MKGLNILYKKIVDNYSMELSLLICALAFISIIYKTSLLYCFQFLLIIVFIYISLKLYEHYMTQINSIKYKFLNGKKLEICFGILLLLSFIFALYFDILSLNF